MTAAKLLTNPPEASGLLPQIVQGHYDDLVHGKPGQLIAAQCLLQPVGQTSRRTKDGWKTTVTYELVRLEPARDSHEADNIAWEITRAYEARTSGSAQQTLPLVNSPAEQRESLIEAIRDWSSTQDVSQSDLDERWLSHFGGPEHAASATVQAGSLLHLMEFSRFIGAVSDPKPGEADDDGFGAGEPDDGDSYPEDGDLADDGPTAAVVPFQAEADDDPDAA